MFPGVSLLAESPIGFLPPPVEATVDDVFFDDFGLQNEFIVVTGANFEDSWSSEFNSYPLPRVDGTGFISRYWRKKSIRLEGYVHNWSKDGMEQKIDAMKKACSVKERQLKYRSGGSSRSITASLSSASFQREHYHLTFCPFVLTFESSDAYWHDEANESVTFSGVTSSRSESLSNSGTGESSPVVHYVLNSATAVSTASFSANGRTLTVTGVFGSWTIITLDGGAKKAYVNGVSVDYSGTFPILVPGENYATFSMDGTFDAEIIAIWPKLYL